MEESILVEEIAIIGMSAKFPKANDIVDFWQNIVNQVNCISYPSMKRRKNWDSLLKQYYKVEEITNEMLAYGGFLEGIDEFDGAVFDK